MNTIKLNLFRSRRVVGLSAFLAVLLMVSGCGDKSAQSAEPSKLEVKNESEKDDKGLKLTDEEQKKAGITLEEVNMRNFEDVVSVTATIRPNQDRIAKISPRVEGRIVSVSVNMGDVVRPRQALALMDSLSIGEAQSALLRAQSYERVAQADFGRAQSLSAEEIIPQKEYLRASGELERASAETRAARDKLRLLGGSASTNGQAQSTFALTAPFAGTVIQKKATVGEMGMPADAVFTIADLSTVWIEANLTDQLLSKVKSGAAATVSVGAYPGESFRGRVAYIANVVDKESRTIAARIEVPNKDGRLKPEMFTTASIATGRELESISVPDSAILLLQGQPTVFISEGGSFESRAVETGDKLPGRTIIKSGLQVKEQVVASGAYALKARLLKSQIGDTH